MGKKPKYEVIQFNNTQLTADVSALAGSGDIWFNATEMARQYNKLPADFLRIDSTKEYLSEIFKDGISHIKNIDDLVNVKRGKYGGTWLHKELAYEFAGWCSALLRRNLHKWVDKRIDLEKKWKRERLEAKTGFFPLTDAIKHAHKEIKPYHFTTECNLLNQIILGMTAKEYREHYSVENVRDNLSTEQLAAFNHLQIVDAGLIEAGIAYEERKNKLREVYTRNSNLLRYREAA